ncbi:hypothetical protein AVE30378_02533 [Achromobacter veterisilvae]|uniref:Bacterial toxin YdaT domain-containing protein n=1 Tax=Achromobacter veterisilvae TaxID=2069367 RepID=A0A446CH87_9BURK|nr:hypothetical protein [Achromobacter veterisilvae]SSW67264.1 hypothetical protein AVE30378_02533 [Achromobacter veterisilvae]
MRHESHKTLIAILREHTSAWRKSQDWSRETMAEYIVAAHETLNGPASTGIRFEPHTQDTFGRLKVNADRVFRWLDDESKDTNLLPANFIPSILAAMPHDRRRHCVDDMLRPLGLAVRTLALEAGDALAQGQVTNLMREQTEAAAAAVALLDANATPAQLVSAHRELSESIVAARGVRAAIEGQMSRAGIDVPAKEADPS